jgi:hypothetical protein
MLRFLVLGLAIAASQAAAVELVLEKDVPFSSLSGTPSNVAFKIYTTSSGGSPVAQQTFPAGQWEADYDFTSYKTTPVSTVRFRALFTNASTLNPDNGYFYAIELDGVVKGSRDTLQNPGWEVFQDVATRTTALPVNCQCQNSLPETTWTQVANVGSFFKRTPSSLIELDYSGILWASSFTGSGVSFEFRIDGVPTTKGRMRNLTRTPGEYSSAASMGIFPGLAAGNHQVTVWALSWWSTAGKTCVDPGCFQTDQILVKEYQGR